MLATYMQRMRNNNLEIRIAGDKEAILGQVPRKMVKFNPVFSQMLSTVFSSKNMQFEVTKYCWAFITRYSNNNTKCYPKQCLGM